MLCYSIGYCQDRTFSYIGLANSEDEIKKIAETTHKALFITNNKVYSIGGDCIGRLLDGNINDRENDGDNDERFKDGNNNDRNKGGDVADRKRKGKNNNRNKRGDNNDRDNDGDSNNRNQGGDVDTRSLDGAIGTGTGCSIAKNGKVLLYTRQTIDSKKAKILLGGKYFDKKYFKIIQL